MIEGIMFSKRKSSFVPHQLGILPCSLEDTETHKLIDNISENNITEEIIQRLFDGHLRLAIKITGQYSRGLRNNLFDIDDLVEEAIKAILDTLLEMSIKINMNNYNFTAHCTVKIHSALIRFIKNRSKNHKIEQLPPKLTYRDNSLLNLEIKELIDKIAVSKREKAVLCLRLQNYRNREISKILNLSESLVKKIRSSLKRRFKIIVNKL